jgi:hypothetical protein
MNKTNDELAALNLEDSEERADITCEQYIAAYALQYGLGNGFESFCRSAVIDATGKSNERLVQDLYAELDPDKRDKSLTIAQTKKVIGKLIDAREGK